MLSNSSRKFRQISVTSGAADIYLFIFFSCTSIAFVLSYVLLFFKKKSPGQEELKQIVMTIIQRTRSPAQRGGHKVNDRKDH